jgi:hypothetical protein
MHRDAGMLTARTVRVADGGSRGRHHLDLPHHVFAGRAGPDDLFTVTLDVDSIFDHACGLGYHGGDLPAVVVNVAQPHRSHGVPPNHMAQRYAP